MSRKLYKLSLLFLAIVLISSCKREEVNNYNVDVDKVEIKQLSPEMLKVRDYVPANAVIAHRGSTFWTPEETEAAYRWGREIGADYLEADLQVSKDGVVLALHDDNLKRTTNIENVYGENVPATRKAYYLGLGYAEADADKMVEADKKNFIPNLPSYYTYEELMKLDAGTWFNQTSIEQARPQYAAQHQYISTLEDLVMYARGKRLKRDGNGERVFTKAKTGKKVKSLSGEADLVQYTFAYENDAQDSGNRPGIYIEFKEPWLNPAGFEQMVFDELSRLDMNIITKPAPANEQFYVNGKVNVGNTNGKVILQTFSLQSLGKIKEVFKGQVPMCFLLWKGNGATDISDDSPEGYASFINLGIDNLAHIIGPSITGAPNNYPELLTPWQAHLIRKAKMAIHPYSFDTQDQMKKYFGDYNYGNAIADLTKPPYADAMFTNRSEMTLQYYIDKGVRNANAPKAVKNPNQLLKELGY